MPEPAHLDTNNVSRLLELERSIRNAESLQSLLYVIVNQTRRLIPFDQAIFLSLNDHEKRPKVKAISNIASIDRSTPFVNWVERIARLENKQSTRLQRHVLSQQNLTESNITDWNEFSPQHIVWMPLIAPQQGLVGILWLARGKAWSEKEFVLLEHLAVSFAHALQIFLLPWSFLKVAKRFFKKPIIFLIICALFLSGLIPVKLSALAPAEVVAIDPFVISSSLNGIVKKILVTPNQVVVSGQPLVLLDDTEVRNKVAVAKEALEVAKVQLEKAERGAFYEEANRNVLAELAAQVDLHRAELRYAGELLRTSTLSSDKKGVAVISQPDEWAGRPVNVGEKILQVADPNQVELLLLLPVTDAILLTKGNLVRVFLDSAPLSPEEAQVISSEYEAYQTEQGILSYRVTARFTKPEYHPRIGLRGTAKVFGQEVSLFYYLFRRPITVVRQWIGW